MYCLHSLETKRCKREGKNKVHVHVCVHIPAHVHVVYMHMYCTYINVHVHRHNVPHYADVHCIYCKTNYKVPLHELISLCTLGSLFSQLIGGYHYQLCAVLC